MPTGTEVVDIPSKRSLPESACSTTDAEKTRKTARLSDNEPHSNTNGESHGTHNDGEAITPLDESLESSVQNTGVVQSQPSMKKPLFVLPRSSLHDRMRSLMPQLKQTPEELAALAKQPLEDVDEGSEHISIELGLGVLQDASAETSSEDTSSDEDDSERAEQDTSRLKKLMGEKDSRSSKVGIEEMG